MASSTSDARVYGLVILGTAGVLAYKGLTGLARHTYRAYEARTKTPQQRIDARIEEARRYARLRKFDHTARAIVAAERIAGDYNAPLPKNFGVIKKSIYSDFLNDAVGRVTGSPTALDVDSLDRFIEYSESVATEIGPTAQNRLEGVLKIAILRHLKLAGEYANRAEDMDDNVTLSWARSHFGRAGKYAAKLTLADHNINSELSSVDMLIREAEHSPPMPYKGGF